MEQDRLGREVVPAEVWAEDKVRAEVEWVDRLLQDRAEIAYALTVAIRYLTSPASLVIKEIAQSAERE
jgi:hypothetical protein